MPATPDAVLITTDGRTTPIALPDDPDQRYIVMKAVICCHVVEAVDVGDRWTMWVDETGGMYGHYRRRPNVVASDLAVRHGTPAHLRGPVLVTGRSEKSTCPLDAEDMAAIEAAVAELVHVEWVTP